MKLQKVFFQSEDNHANKFEVILFMLLLTDAHVAVHKHGKLQGLYKLLKGRNSWNSTLGRQLNQKPTIRNKWLFKGCIIHTLTKDHLLETNTSFILSAALEKSLQGPLWLNPKIKLLAWNFQNILR